MSRSFLRASLRPSLALGLALGLVIAGCHGGKPKDATASIAPVLTVTVEPATARGLGHSLELTGAIAAWDPLPVNPAANGLRIMQVLAEEGQRVHKGQLLAKLDDATLTAQLAQARARAAASGAALAKTRNPSRPQDLQTAQAAYDQAQASAVSAEDTYRRYQELARDGGVSASDLIARQTTAQSARAAADQARERLSLAREGSRREDIQSAEASAAEARANVRQMQAMLAQTRVVAPADGVIIRRDAHMGDVSTVGRSLFTLVRDDRLEMDALASEGDLGALRVGQAVTVSSDARQDLSVAGRVRIVSPSLDTSSRQATVKIDLPRHAGFQVGMFARARIELGARESLSVPSSAVIARESGAQVFVLDNGVARARDIKTGDRAGNYVAVLAGLAPGESVITAGGGFLKDGDHVAVAPSLGGSPAPAASSNTTASAPAAPGGTR